jgi:hypothetical protein
MVTYGLCPVRGMGYGLLRTYGLWYAIPIRKNFFAHSLMGVYVVLVARIVLPSARSILPGTT